VWQLVALADLPELGITNWKEELYRMLGRKGVGCYKGMEPNYARLAKGALKLHWPLLLMAALGLFAVCAVLFAVQLTRTSAPMRDEL
jgi:hypothetical protein